MDAYRMLVTDSGSKFNINSVSESDAGKYTCTGRNAQGSATKEFMLTIVGKIKVKDCCV